MLCMYLPTSLCWITMQHHLNTCAAYSCSIRLEPQLRQISLDSTQGGCVGTGWPEERKKCVCRYKLTNQRAGRVCVGTDWPIRFFSWFHQGITFVDMSVCPLRSYIEEIVNTVLIGLELMVWSVQLMRREYTDQPSVKANQKSDQLFRYNFTVLSVVTVNVSRVKRLWFVCDHNLSTSVLLKIIKH